jgi:hypothetical protein
VFVEINNIVQELQPNSEDNYIGDIRMQIDVFQESKEIIMKSAIL